MRGHQRVPGDGFAHDHSGEDAGGIIDPAIEGVHGEEDGPGMRVGASDPAENGSGIVHKPALPIHVDEPIGEEPAVVVAGVEEAMVSSLAMEKGIVVAAEAQETGEVGEDPWPLEPRTHSPTI
jgi:hypothetical protein